jgi:hypothetical protein
MIAETMRDFDVVTVIFLSCGLDEVNAIALNGPRRLEVNHAATPTVTIAAELMPRGRNDAIFSGTNSGYTRKRYAHSR